MAQWFVRALGLVMLLHLAEALWQQQPWHGLLWTLATACLWRGARTDIGLRGPRAPRCLRWNGEGRFWLQTRDGRQVAVEPLASSLSLGRGMLLVLREAGQGRHRHRVYLHPGFVTQVRLATLQRAFATDRAARGDPPNFLY